MFHPLLRNLTVILNDGSITGEVPVWIDPMEYGRLPKNGQVKEVGCFAFVSIRDSVFVFFFFGSLHSFELMLMLLPTKTGTGHLPSL